MAKSKPGAIHLRIAEVMKRFPEGITGGQIRHELEREGLRPEDQTHLDRRKRDLKKWLVIEKTPATRPGSDGTPRKVVLPGVALRGQARFEFSQGVVHQILSHYSVLPLLRE
jgi:hypothetical protein